MTETQTPRDLPFDRRVRLADQVLIQDLDGESVFLNLESELYLGLNKSGSEILKDLLHSDSIEDAYSHLLDNYDIEPDRLRSELRRFVAELLEQGLIELTAP